MKKAIVISTLVAAAIVNSGQAHAEASKEENVGFASGAIAGAALGGPIGLIIGAATGAILGEQVEKANDLEEVKQELSDSINREKQLSQEIAMIQENMEFEHSSTNTDKSAIDSQWMTEGLTLNVMFTTNSSELSDNDFANVRKLSALMVKFPELNIQLDGYSDPRGTKASNLKLSQHRVNAVKQAFETYGISADRVIAKAHGEVSGTGIEGNMDAYAMARKVSVNFVTQTDELVAQN
ncbi:OmpA family protein [Aliikangiella coralliicola]|uniref:DUF456 family protein n=1 Tax=Aliikangiella coralliicola TaxID=2592383 RepID=A0A545U4X4_9GAMM|nr:OmpA family protein [Aliikangiella coralliicola]TQV84519.1 DUF456 family protein [Aliikangiella coralliicola]